MQRTLASKSLAEGQMGIVFAAFLKLIIPFVVVVPGILAYNLYRNDLKEQAEVKYAAEIRKTEDPAAVKGAAPSSTSLRTASWWKTWRKAVPMPFITRK